MSFNSAEEQDKLANLQSITSLPEDVCLRVLRSNNWDLEISLNRVFDGQIDDVRREGDAASNAHQASENESSTTTGTSNELRRRNPQLFVESDSGETVPANSSRIISGKGSIVDPGSSITGSGISQNSASFLHDHPNNASHHSRAHTISASQNSRGEDTFERNDNEQSLVLSAWTNIRWLIRIPFTIIFTATQILYDFLTSIINPTLYYDSTGTVQRFIQEFEAQYGNNHPPMATETYENVIARAKRELRFGLIYIHSPKHRDTDRFCRTVIATDRFKNFINSENLIFWSCSTFFPDGYTASQAVSFTSYPFMFIVGLKNSKMVILKTFEGFQNLETTISRIKNAIDNNEVHLISARLDRETNYVNNLIRQQQDAALQESLRKDQEKERKLQEEADKKAAEERKQKEKENEERQRLDNIMELKKTLITKLNAEPESSNEQSINLSFRLPNGKRLERRFNKTDSVKQLYFYVFCNDESLINFKLKTNFPSRELPGHSPVPEIDLNSSEMNTTLSACELENNIVLYVHDLDA